MVTGGVLADRSPGERVPVQVGCQLLARIRIGSNMRDSLIFVEEILTHCVGPRCLGGMPTSPGRALIPVAGGRRRQNAGDRRSNEMKLGISPGHSSGRLLSSRIASSVRAARTRTLNAKV